MQMLLNHICSDYLDKSRTLVVTVVYTMFYVKNKSFHTLTKMAEQPLTRR